MSAISAPGADDLDRRPRRPTDRLAWWEEPGVIHVAGVIDAATTGTFSRVLISCERDPCVHTLDLSTVEFFSSAGARCFVERGWPDRPHVSIIASTIVRRVLSMCELEYLLDQHGWERA